MARAQIAAGLLLAGTVLLSCGGGGSSPTEPEPVPTTVAGTWRGQISGTVDGAAFTCPLEIVLQNAGGGIFVGPWSADCPGGTVAGPATATRFTELVIVIALRSGVTDPAHPLGVCGWSAPTSLSGSELTGDWEPPDGCADPSLAGGSLSVRYAG